MSFRSVTNQVSIGTPSPLDSTTITGTVVVTSTGDIPLISSGAGSIYVYGYSLAAPSTIANNGITIRLISGSTTATCWQVALAGPSSAATGLSEMFVTPPSFLFRTAAGDALNWAKGGSSVAGSITSYAFAFWRQ